MTHDIIYSNVVSFTLAMLFSLNFIAGNLFASMEFLFIFLIMVFVDLVFENDWKW